MQNLDFSSTGPGPNRAASRSAALVAAAGLTVAVALASSALPGAKSAFVETSAFGYPLGLVGDTSKADDSLASVLARLAQYDRGPDDRLLWEALRWFDRKWAAGDDRAIALSQPLHARVCRHHRLQWSWLCESGE